MWLAESLATLKSKLGTIDQVIFEDKGHLDHPEDLVFLQDVDGANRALVSMQKTIKRPKTVTIKWDGYPALIFGRNQHGKFSIMDKHMFNKKDGSGRQIFSPKQFQQYDQARGVDRSDLHRLVSEIWSGLEKASRGTKGYYWGDLLFNKPLMNMDGVYNFKANPNGITYSVKAKSSVGRLLTDKTAGIAVHQQLSPDAPTTDYAQTLNGSIGQLKNNSDVAIVPSAMPIVPDLTPHGNLEKNAQQTIAQYGDEVKKMMNSAPMARNSFSQLFTTYINKRIVSGNLKDLYKGFLEYVNNRSMSDTMKKKLLGYTVGAPAGNIAEAQVQKVPGYLDQNKDGLIGAFKIWIALYNLKMHIVSQLNDAAKDSPVQGALDDGTKTHEGFVSNGLKFVDRMGFSRQNLAGRA
jgi:hypothetical protein